MTTKMTAQEPQPIFGTRDLLLKTLKKMGCQYEFDDNDDISFFYQGEQFSAISDNTDEFISLYDYGWYSANLDDIDELSLLRKAINEVNWVSDVNIVFAFNEDEREMIISSRVTLLFVDTIPYLDDYLKTVLNEFFRAKRLLMMERDRLRESESRK